MCDANVGQTVARDFCQRFFQARGLVCQNRYGAKEFEHLRAQPGAVDDIELTPQSTVKYREVLPVRELRQVEVKSAIALLICICATDIPVFRNCHFGTHRTSIAKAGQRDSYRKQGTLEVTLAELFRH